MSNFNPDFTTDDEYRLKAEVMIDLMLSAYELTPQTDEFELAFAVWSNNRSISRLDYDDPKSVFLREMADKFMENIQRQIDTFRALGYVTPRSGRNHIVFKSMQKAQLMFRAGIGSHDDILKSRDEFRKSFTSRRSA